VLVKTKEKGAICITDIKAATSPTYRSFATTASQLKISDFLRETFKGFEVL